MSLLTGEPEYLEPLREEAPVGWIVTGYPYYGIQTDEHKKFFLAYFRKYNEYPKLGSVVGYSTIISIAEGIKKAKSTDTEKLIAAFRGLQFMSPLGKVTYRAIDHQSTMGAYLGKTKLEGQQGRDDRLRLHRRRQGPAERRRGEEAAGDRLTSSALPAGRTRHHERARPPGPHRAWPRRRRSSSSPAACR